MLSFPPEKAALSPRHPLTQIHGRLKKETERKKKKEMKTTNPEQEDKVVVVRTRDSDGERGSGGVNALGGFIWGAGPGFVTSRPTHI